jgi:hypothetical protein
VNSERDRDIGRKAEHPPLFAPVGGKVAYTRSRLQGFKSPGSAQRLLSLHAATYTTFTVPRHLVSARTHRLFQAEPFVAWRSAAGVTI